MTGSDEHFDEYGRPVGPSLPEWTSPPRPTGEPMVGQYVELVAPDVDAHAPALFEAFSDPADWTYLFQGPFDDVESFTAWFDGNPAGDGSVVHTIMVNGTPVGMASFMRIDERVGSIEVGGIHFAPALQRTPAATEAMFLMMQRAFDLGYRRYEWKCDALNAPSRASAKRLGFTFEGVFRHAIVYKGRNRDTAWFSIIDTEWPALRAEFTRWLDPSNFDANGNQRSRLNTAHCIAVTE